MSINEFDKFVNKKIKLTFLPSRFENNEYRVEIGKIVHCDLGKFTHVIDDSTLGSLKPYICTFVNENNDEIKIIFDSIIEIDIL